mgnify:CR=1 FL=1
MEKKLNEYLREGETIRWQGQPANFPLMDNGSRMQILRKWALTVIIAAGALIAHMQSQMPPRMGFSSGCVFPGSRSDSGSGESQFDEE